MPVGPSSNAHMPQGTAIGEGARAGAGVTTEVGAGAGTGAKGVREQQAQAEATDINAGVGATEPGPSGSSLGADEGAVTRGELMSEKQDATLGTVQGGTDEGSWSGRASGDLGKRIRCQVVGVFHEAAVACPMVTKAVLQVILSVVWNLDNNALQGWGCLLGGDSFSCILLSDQSCTIKAQCT
ncbi:unnamed protein product [Discosporangium mesarthrocarpum]